MARSLETVFADFKPSHLQQAAIDRIQEMKAELKSYGLYVRSAMELEFMVQDQTGRRIPGVVQLNRALQFLKEKENLPHIEDFKLEGDLMMCSKRPEIISQYEVNVAEDENWYMGKPKEFAPENIACVVEKLKTQSLSRMLMESTCLNTPAHIQQLQFLSPNFDAKPHENNIDTSALHVNLSLFSKDGENAFAMFPPLLEHSAQALVQIQKEAALAMLPNDNSLKRIRANSSAPGGIGVEIGKFFNGNAHTSVTIRRTLNDRYDEEARIENRLPGADADPFVAMAVSMAALLETVRTHTHKEYDESGKQTGVKIHQVRDKSYARHEIPNTRSALVDSYIEPEHARHLRGLLGDKLYTAILNEYGAGQAMTR